MAPLSSWSTANGPYDVGSARPSTPATSRAAAQVSLHVDQGVVELDAHRGTSRVVWW